MRLATMASVAVLALSSAALAQVASSPVEQKTSTDNVAAAGKMEGADNGVLPNAAADTASASGNDVAPSAAPARTPRRR